MSNLKLYVVGWLYVITGWQEQFFTRNGLGPNNNGQLPGAPAIVLNVCTRSAVPGAGSLWLEQNAPLVARGDAYFFTGVNMTESEVRAIGLLLQPYPQAFPQWLDPNGNAYVLPSSMLRIGGSYLVGTFFPQAPAGIIVAGGWAQVANGPDPGVTFPRARGRELGLQEMFALAKPWVTSQLPPKSGWPRDQTAKNWSHV